MATVPFVTIFIAALFALNLHLPKNSSVPVKTTMTNAQGLKAANQICLNLMKHILGHEVKNIEDTFKPLIEKGHEQKNTSVGNDFLGKFSMTEILETISTLCATDFDTNSAQLQKIDIQSGISYYNSLVNNLPDVKKLRNINKIQTSKAYSQSGELLGAVNTKKAKSKLTASQKEINKSLIQAFLSAEDKSFYSHTGIDLAGLLKAFLNSGTGSQLYGGSTITQQLIKNALLSYERSLERKIKEFILAKKVTEQFSKDETLLLYLNYINFGRGTYGVKAAANAYFGKELSELRLEEMAFLASLPQSPNSYDPEKNYEVIFKRRNKVLKNMLENKFISQAQHSDATARAIEFIPSYISNTARTSSYFVSGIENKLNVLNKNGTITADKSYYVQSTVNSKIQKALTTSLQEGLITFEKTIKGSYSSWNKKRVVQTNIATLINKAKKDIVAANKQAQSLKDHEQKNRSALNKLKGRNKNSSEDTDSSDDLDPPSENPDTVWITLLKSVPHNFLDTSWLKATVLTGGKSAQIGLESGETVKLNSEKNGIQWQGKLKVGDVVYVEKIEHSDSKPAYYFLRRAPEVQGAAVVLDVKTGAILAMSGGFSYQQSSWNRALFGLRQPGSTLKPFVYLAALDQKIQPNHLIYNGQQSFPPITQGGKWWTPGNTVSSSDKWLSLRRGLVTSNNYMTAFLLNIIAEHPIASLDMVRKYTEDTGIYDNSWDHTLSFILGAQPTSLLRLTSAYAQLANNGTQTEPYNIEFIRIDSQKGALVYKHEVSENLRQVPSDNISLFQLQTMLQEVTSIGTARVLKDHSHYLAGKTGTSNQNQDAWFVGYTPKIAVGVWVGYDNQDNKNKKFLGKNGTGGRVAAPVVKSFLEDPYISKMHQDGNISLPTTTNGIEIGYFDHELSVFRNDNPSEQYAEFFRPGPWKDNYLKSASQFTDSGPGDVSSSVYNFFDDDLPGTATQRGNNSGSASQKKSYYSDWYEDETSDDQELFDTLF